MSMLKNVMKMRRALRTLLRSLHASLQGPRRRREKVKHIFSTFGAERTMSPEDMEHCARVYFRRRAFRRLKRAIKEAQSSIEMQMFIWLDDRTGRDIAKLFVEAANRGVRIIIRKEVIGDVFEFSDDFASTKTDPHPVWHSFWNHPRITVIHDNHHDHSKTLVIDESLLLISSMNIGDAYCYDWHECLVSLHGKHFVDDYRRGGVDLPRLTKRGTVSVLRSSAEQPMLPAVLSLIASAQKSIRIEMAYFSDPTIVEHLAKKTHEGVYLFLLLPETPDIHRHANMVAVSKLLSLARKRRTFVFRYTRGLLHTKMIIVDRKTIFIGSTNLITSSLTKMGETNVLIHRHPQRCLRVIRRQFARDVLQSVKLEAGEITRTSWQRLLSNIGL